MKDDSGFIGEMIMIDCHMHLHESMVSLPGLLASMDRFGIDRVALMARMNPPIEKLPSILKRMSPRLRRAIFSSDGWRHRQAVKFYNWSARDDGTVLIGRRSLAIIPQPDNSAVASAVAKHPDRFWGWIFVNPSHPTDQLAELEKYGQTPGMIGVKAHPYWHGYPVSDLLDIADWCAQKGMPMLIHLGAGRRGDYGLLPDKFPSLTIIYAHAGVPYGQGVWGLAQEKKNVYIDLSCSAYVDLKAARLAVSRAGAGKCLFGSDGPYFHAAGDRFDYSERLDLIAALNLSQDDRDGIVRRNFAEIVQA